MNHPNLVQLMGYASQPRLLIVQELLLGNSLDQQLYVELWRPTPREVRKIAMDVATGMRYLHTAFEDKESHDQAVIHRDLKSPNLLLAQPPGPGVEIQVKITDFGLSKDKSLDESKQVRSGSSSRLDGDDY